MLPDHFQIDRLAFLEFRDELNTRLDKVDRRAMVVGRLVSALTAIVAGWAIYTATVKLSWSAPAPFLISVATTVMTNWLLQKDLK
jgi:hypothetical protein